MANLEGRFCQGPGPGHEAMLPSPDSPTSLTSDPGQLTHCDPSMLDSGLLPAATLPGCVTLNLGLASLTCS